MQPPGRSEWSIGLCLHPWHSSPQRHGAQVTTQSMPRLSRLMPTANGVNLWVSQFSAFGRASVFLFSSWLNKSQGAVGRPGRGGSSAPDPADLSKQACVQGIADWPLCCHIAGDWSPSPEAEPLLTSLFPVVGQVKAVLEEILERVTDEFNIPELAARAQERTPYVVVVLQECERMNVLLRELQGSLRELDLGLKVGEAGWARGTKAAGEQGSFSDLTAQEGVTPRTQSPAGLQGG